MSKKTKQLTPAITENVSTLRHAKRLPHTVEPPPTAYQFPHPSPLEVLWSDPWLVAVNKPHNELSVPGKPPLNKHSTHQRTRALFNQALVIHRLDGATSGILLFARNPWIQKRMHAYFRQRWVHKTYCALVSGHLAGDCGTINLPLATDWHNRPRQQLDWQQGKASVTHWRKQPLGFSSPTPCTRVLLTPVTGRTHQLRVHLMALSHPILGDRLYHPEATESTSTPGLTSRLHLHARTLQFNHPITGEHIVLDAPTPF